MSAMKQFNLNDKVRIKGVAYNEGEFDTISMFNNANDTARLDYHDGGQDWWDIDELYFYYADTVPSLKESSLIDQTAPLHATIAEQAAKIAALEAKLAQAQESLAAIGEWESGNKKTPDRYILHKVAKGLDTTHSAAPVSPDLPRIDGTDSEDTI